MPESLAPSQIDERQDPDQGLVEQVLAGAEDAFALLLLKYQRKILNFMYRMSGDREMAEDLTQEIFLKAYEGLSRFRREATFSTWLYRIAHNHGLNAIKARGREGKFNPHVTLPDSSERADQRLEQREREAIVQEKLLELPPEQREVLILRDIQGFSYDQIASALNLEAGTVRSRIHRARMELKERLREYLEV